MGIDWNFAGQVGGVGFLMVFFLLVILAVAIWLTGLMVRKTSTTKNKPDNTQKGA
jgi:Na+-transporting methylmalonyl-CoA/oxaloacetate decarboxylase gamma subunit